MRWTDHAATVDHIERSLHTDLRLERVADHLGFSPYHLHRSFRRTFGLTLLTYVRRRRLTEAARALSDTSEPVVDVALRHGFGSQQSFTHEFTAHYGAPPAAWRRERRFSPLLLPYRFGESDWNALGDGAATQITERADVDHLLSLSFAAVDMLPGLDRDQHVAALHHGVAARHVLLARQCDRAAAAMVIDPATGHVEFLAVHPLARRTPVLRSLTAAARVSFPRLTISTFRDGDRADVGHRRALLAHAFTPARLRTEFGYPTQLLEHAGARG